MRTIVRMVVFVLSYLAVVPIAEAQQPLREGRFQLFVAASVNEACTQYSHLLVLMLNKKRSPEPGGVDPIKSYETSREECMRPRLYKIDTATGEVWVETTEIESETKSRIVRKWEPFNVSWELPPMGALK
jgi:hypothetical protein